MFYNEVLRIKLLRRIQMVKWAGANADNEALHRAWRRLFDIAYLLRGKKIMKPGYAYVAKTRHPHAEELETEMVVQSECESAQAVGVHQIDGLKYLVFASNGLYYFQRPC